MVIVPLRFSVAVGASEVPPQAAASIPSRANRATPTDPLHRFQVTNGLLLAYLPRLPVKGPETRSPARQGRRQLKRFSRNLIRRPPPVKIRLRPDNVRREGMSRVRIADVAKAARVSNATVSFAFNKPHEISEATVKRVMAVARRLGYTPHPTARSLSTKRSGSIGFLIPQSVEVVFANPFVSDLIRGVGEICEQHDLTMLLVPPLNGSLESAIGRAAVDGFSSLDTFRRLGLPCILVDADPQPGIATINIDDFGGAAAAAAHLLELGHRRIAVVGLGEPRDRGESGIGARRLAGYRQTIRAAGGAPPRVVPAGVTFASGQAAFRQLWRAKHHPTAVLAMSDMAAIGLMATAREHGVLLPEELSVVGYDDIPMASWVTPMLTSVRQPIAEKGRQAARLLIAQLGGKQVRSPRPLATELVVRQSTTTPRP